jgi:hypothetical protein
MPTVCHDPDTGFIALNAFGIALVGLQTLTKIRGMYPSHKCKYSINDLIH